MVLTRRLRESIATRARALPLARHAWARYRRRKYERRIERFVTEKTGRADRLPDGRRLRSDDAVQPALRVLLRRRPAQHRGGVARRRWTSTRCARRSPSSDGFQVSLTGGEIFMRKDIMSVLDLFREKGYACGYLTTNGTIITEERAEALADLAAAGLPQAHQRLDRRARGAPRRRARPEGHVRADDCRAAAAAGRRPAQARAAARQHQHHRRAREPRGARPDGGRRRRARRRRDRPQSPDVQHARGSGRDGPA